MNQTSTLTSAVPAAELPTGQCVVIKVGTSTLMGPHGPDQALMGRLADVLSQLVSSGNRVVLVSSGAVGTGCWRLGDNGEMRSVPEKQAAAAAVGQGILMHLYDRAFAERGLMSAQLLLTRADLAIRQRYINAKNTLSVLLSSDAPVIPIVNENDSVTVEEITFGDNDNLSALVADLVGADRLFILSDVDGLYDADPRQNPEAKRLNRVENITPDIEALAGGAGSSMGTGGMATKVAAARIATACGIPMVLLDGQHPELVIESLSGGEVGTTFEAGPCMYEGRKRWMAFNGLISGTLTIDEGAAHAIREGGGSLLPAGVRKLTGEFQPGDLVTLVDEDGHEVARGLVNYSTEQLMRIRGYQGEEIAQILGHLPHDEAVHRKNMVVTFPLAM